MNNDYDNVNFDDMDEDEFFRVLWAAYFKMIDEYEGVMVLNPVQYRKYNRALEILEGMVEERGGNFQFKKLNPPECHGWAAIEIDTIDVSEKLEKLKELLSCVDVFGVEPSVNDSIFVGINVNNVWVKADDEQGIGFGRV